MQQFDIKRVREDFPILGREVRSRPLVYLDNAATAQKPRRVLAAMEDIYTRSNANVHRGTHCLSGESTALYEAARETVGEFIGAHDREEVIFTSGATASLNVAAYGLCELLVGEGDNIIVSEMEHHSNIVPWQIACAQRRAEIRVLPVTDEGLPDTGRLEGLIDSRTRILAVTQCSNVLGTRPDIARIVGIAHSRGVVVVVDGCQGVVHGKVNVAELDCDFYAFSGHKLYAPLGTGVLYGKKELLERIPPLFGGGEMVKNVSFSGTTYAGLPYRLEAGTPNYAGAAGLAEAIRYLADFDPCEIEHHERELLEIATVELSKIEGLRIYGTAPGKAPIVSFTVEGTHPLDIGMLLDGRGIAIRTGTHCAQPLMERFGVSSMCRASFALYNTVDEARALAAGVAEAVKRLRR